MKREQDHRELEQERDGLWTQIVVLETYDYLLIFGLVPRGFILVLFDNVFICKIYL